ncbi:MAG: hypothetical protein RIC55_24800 [Pirellulaceae bacterium]
MYYHCKSCRKLLAAPKDIESTPGICPACGHASGIDEVLGADALAAERASHAASSRRLISRRYTVPLAVAAVGLFAAVFASIEFREQSRENLHDFVIGFAWAAADPNVVLLQIGLATCTGVVCVMLQSLLLRTDFGPLLSVALKVAAVTSIFFVVATMGVLAASLPAISAIPESLLADRNMLQRNQGYEIEMTWIIKMGALVGLLALVLFVLTKLLFQLEIHETLALSVLLILAYVLVDSVLCWIVPAAVEVALL